MQNQLANLVTEKRNVNSMKIDQMATMEILRTINNEDQKVAKAVESVLSEVEVAITYIHNALENGGRLFYVGAGTSGRLGVIDASECPPTFMTPPELIQTVMAGGDDAFFNAVEGTEDKEDQGRLDLQAQNISKNDAVIGITASGRTPYPIGALKYAKKIGAYTVSLTCNESAIISKYADCKIEVIVGPEVLTGSTRMKAATSHKMILNMISTTVMIKLGKVYENLMIDVHASNYKLLERAKRIIMETTNATYQEAEQALHITNKEVKPAIVMIKAGVSLEEAKSALAHSKGFVRKAIENCL